MAKYGGTRIKVGLSWLNIQLLYFKYFLVPFLISTTIKNIFPYLVNAKCFVLSSLWEDPGFVLIEAAICRTTVLTNNSWPGPEELIKDKINGFVYEKNNLDSFYEKFNSIKEFASLKYIKKNNLIKEKKFTIFNHYKSLNSLLSMNE